MLALGHNVISRMLDEQAQTTADLMVWWPLQGLSTILVAGGNMRLT